MSGRRFPSDVEIVSRILLAASDRTPRYDELDEASLRRVNLIALEALLEARDVELERRQDRREPEDLRPEISPRFDPGTGLDWCTPAAAVRLTPRRRGRACAADA